MEIDRITIAADHLSPLVDLQNVIAVAAMGLDGDRHFGNPAQQNITVREGLLPRTRGLRISVGEVLLEVFADAAACNLMEELHGPGAKLALKRLAGIHCRVIEGGSIAVGDLFVPVAS